MRLSRYIFLLPLLAMLISSIPATEVSAISKPKMCPVHHIPLKKEKLEISYGLVIDPCHTADRAKAQEKYFPYANLAVYGGCVVTPDSPKYQEVLYCSRCRAVANTWRCEKHETPTINKLPRL
jgi:hypothetical protein